MRKGIVGAGNLIVDKIKVIDRWPGEGNLCNIRSTVSSAGGGPCNVLFDIAAADPAVQASWLGEAIHPGAAGHLEMAKEIFRKFDVFDPEAMSSNPAGVPFGIPPVG